MLEISTQKEVYALGKYVGVFEDTSAVVTFDEIRSSQFQNKFERSDVDALNYGVTPSVLWIKIQLKNLEPNPNIQWLISLDYPLFDYVNFYQKNPKGEWVVQKTGDKFPYSERQIPDRNFVFATHFPYDTVSTFYLRFETNGSMQITPSLYRERAYLVSNNNAEIAYGLFFGGMMIIMLYNLFLFFSLKDVAYLAYCIFIVASFSLQAAYSGHFIKYWYGDNPYWANLMIPLIMVINPITMAIFSIIFLKTKKFAPLWHKILIGIIGVGCVHFVLIFYLPIIKSIPFSGLITTVALFAVFFAGIAAYRKGNKSARFYLVAWFLLIIVALLAAFRLFGVVPSNNLTVHGVKLAILSEIVLLALALADKYNIFRKEKEDAQQKILQMQEEANKVLEEKVEQRTVELAEANHKLSNTLSKVEEER
ncbi:MAG: 7TM diverse intracellular signaling domain-containing protein, partial [Bacteroidota bacterium]